MDLRARVRGVFESDEDLIAGLPSFAFAVERSTALLARCVNTLGGVETPGAEAVRNLSLGAREALLLEVRRRTFGERMECVQPCPACRGKMSFEVRVEDLIQLGPKRQPERFAEIFTVDGMEFRVRCRVPTGADLEIAVGAMGASQHAAVKTLLGRCLEDVRRGGDTVSPAELPEKLVSALSARMVELDPLAEIRLDLTCPGCGIKFDVLFDAGEYLIAELEMWQKKLFQEVHRLALAYHWREEDILRMQPRKRRIYLDLLAMEEANE